MRTLISFDLSGKFAHFNFPFTNKKYLKKSYSILPRTTLLGLLGAIIGLKGLQDFNDTPPEYYKRLRHIPISICLNDSIDKKLIKYGSLNSFADNSSNGGNVIMQEEILLNPKYKILLILDDSKEIDKTLINTFSKKNISSVYPIYLGKNEFFANISEVEIFSENDFEKGHIQFEELRKTKDLKSVIPAKYVSKEQLENSQGSFGNVVPDSFSYDIDFTDKKLKTKEIEVVYFLEKEEQRGNLVFNKEMKLLNLKGDYYFFFEDEIFRDLSK